MVSWAGDGTLVGYSGTTKKLEPGLYKFASPGSVDVNAITRIRYYLTPGLLNQVNVTAPFTFTSADIPSSGWTPEGGFFATAFFLKASDFTGEGNPTPAQIIFHKLAGAWRSDHYLISPQTYTFNIPGPVPGDLEPGTKYWVAVVPTQVRNLYSNPGVSSDDILWGHTPGVPGADFANINANSRALSFWTNRTPGAPVITSPPAKSAAVAGSTVRLTFATTDPDTVSPDDPDRVNRDLAGVQVQYSPVPTQNFPNPSWRDLPYVDAMGALNKASYVIGQKAPSPGDQMVKDLGLPILVGADSAPARTGLLPPGSWRIRVRVADYGNPHPTSVNSPDNKTPGIWTMDNYPAINTSPWSEPIEIDIPTQVPPPVPLSPTSSIAVAEGGVRLAWDYKNTKSPLATPPGPAAQSERFVQIRKVGDPNWSTVYAGVSGNHFVDLPQTIDNPPAVPPQEYLTDTGFEGGTLGGWVIPPGGLPTGPIVNTSAAAGPGGSHAGSRHLSVSYETLSPASGLGVASFYREILASALQPTHTRFTFTGWAGLDEETYALTVQFLWADLEGNPYLSPDGEIDPRYRKFLQIVKPLGGWAPQWRDITFEYMDRPPGASKLIVLVQYLSENPASPGKGRLDDVSIIGLDPYQRDDFTMSPTTQYEWRVSVKDTDDVESAYSVPARFWMVPLPASGEVVPVPSNTIDGATLGCGEHRVFIYRRGGKERVGEIKNMVRIEWSRTRDDISVARINIKGWDIDCGNLLSRLQTWAYEVVIFRANGFSVDRVWEGPISLLTYKETEVVIQAKDVMNYAYRRIIKQAMSNSGKGNGSTVVNRGMRVLQNVFAPDDPNVLSHLQIIEGADDAMQYRSTPAYSRTAFEEVDDMASNQGLDYVVVGRAILLWGTKNRIGLLPEFKDENLGAAPIVSEYGMSFANRYAVSDGDGTFGEATRGIDPVSGNDPIYGLVEMLSSTWASDSPEEAGVYSEDALATISESFAASAEQSITSKYPPPVVVRVPDNTSLHPNTTISIQHLVPGVAIPLRSSGTLREVRAMQKLDSVRVVEEAGKETISITMSPFSSNDAAPTEGETEE